MFFFKPAKPKSFNFKPVYHKTEQENKTGKITFSDKMYQQWNRTPYADLIQKGKKRVFSIALSTLFAIYLVYKVFEYLNNSN